MTVHILVAYHVIRQELENLNIIDRFFGKDREDKLNLKLKKDDYMTNVINALLQKCRIDIDEANKLLDSSTIKPYMAQKISEETQTLTILRLTNEKSKKNVKIYVVLPGGTCRRKPFSICAKQNENDINKCSRMELFPYVQI